MKVLKHKMSGSSDRPGIGIGIGISNGFSSGGTANETSEKLAELPMLLTIMPPATPLNPSGRELSIAGIATAASEIDTSFV